MKRRSFLLAIAGAPAVAILPAAAAVTKRRFVNTIRLQLDDCEALSSMRLDNVTFILNKRWIAARGTNVDVQQLLRAVPGGVKFA